MRYAWYPSKQRVNLKKHGVEFADAAIALEDEQALTVIDEDSQCEYRFLTLCEGPLPGVFMVGNTEEIDEVITIISARPAEPPERRQYYEGINNGY